MCVSDNGSVCVCVCELVDERGERAVACVSLVK